MAMAATMAMAAIMASDDFRRLGHDPEEADICASVLLSIHRALPDPPVSVDARLFALLPKGQDSVDRVSLLPDVLLRNVVSRLPVKDGARTAALSRRWRGVWRSAPLVLVDSHILPAGTAIARDDVRRVAAAVSRILAAHPGPFRCVRVTSGYMEEFSGLLTRWLQILAAKGIQELVLLSRPTPVDLLPPAAFLGMATLTRFYLGFWEFPDTADLPRAASFPNLRELGLCNVLVESADLDFFLARCPVLETLCLKGKLVNVHLRLGSRTIRCVQIMGSFVEEITLIDAPCLERLIQSGGWTRDGVSAKLKIGHAPKLHMLGYLVVGNTVLEVGNTVIKAGTMASPSTTVPSVRVLALEVRFGVCNDAKMIPAILRCFPNIETLHIKSGETDQRTGKLNLKFWQESAGTINCIRSRIKLLAFHDFRGERRELSFLKFFFGSALVLKEAVIVLANGSFTSVEDVRSKVLPLGSMKWASPAPSIKIARTSDPDGCHLWSFKTASDFSLSDPFVNY